MAYFMTFVAYFPQLHLQRSAWCLLALHLVHDCVLVLIFVDADYVDYIDLGTFLLNMSFLIYVVDEVCVFTSCSVFFYFTW